MHNTTHNTIFFAFIPCEAPDSKILQAISSTLGATPSDFKILRSVYNLPTNYRLVQCLHSSHFSNLLNAPCYLNDAKLLAWEFEGKKTINKFFDTFLQKTAFVTGVPKRIDLDQIRQVINDVGEIIELYVVQNKTGNNRHYGFTIFKSLEEFHKATSKKNFKLINGVNGKKVKICCKRFKPLQIKKFKYSLMEDEEEGGISEKVNHNSAGNEHSHQGGTNLIEQGSDQKYFPERRQEHHHPALDSGHSRSRFHIHQRFKNKSKDQPQGFVQNRNKSGYSNFENDSSSYFRNHHNPPSFSSIQERISQKQVDLDYRQVTQTSFGRKNYPGYQSVSNLEIGEVEVYLKSGLGSRQAARKFPVLGKIYENHLSHKRNLVFRWKTPLKVSKKMFLKKSDQNEKLGFKF